MTKRSDALKSFLPDRSLYLTSVVSRLRATFLFFALVSCSATVFGVWQLSKLDRSHAQLVVSAVPTLRHTHELQDQLSVVLELAARVADGKSYEELNRLQQELSKRTTQISTAIQSEEWPEKTLGIRKKVANLLNKLQNTQASGVAHRQEVLRIDENLRQHWEALRQTRESFRELVEPLLVSSANTLELADTQFSQPDPVADQVHRATVSKQIIYQMNLTQISYRFSALIDTAEKRLGDNRRQSVTEWAKRLRFEFSGVMQVLIRLPAGPRRQDLAAELSNTRDILFSDTGMVALLTSRDSKTAEIQQTNSERFAVIARIDQYANALVSAASDDADKAAVDFREDLTGALTVMAVTLLVVLSVLTTAWLLVVKRQISRRMSHLTEAMSAIADGDIDTPVDIAGHDELSKMAAALEVFKSNATALRRSNEELESFAYAAAHDMRSPLRAIENLAHWTLEDAGNDLPAGCRQNLEKLLSRANRLSRLQADLLDYSRVGQAEDDHAILALPVLIESIRELVDADHQFTFELEVPQATVQVPQSPLRQILINLITNAIKHHDNVTGTIWIKGEIKDDRLVIAVTDDGPGIEPQFHERIFKLFQTLKSRDVVEGSGLGLSFVMKQVSRYGGGIQVISEPALKRGTTFIFDLPAQQIEDEFETTTTLPLAAETSA